MPKLAPISVAFLAVFAMASPAAGQVPAPAGGAPARGPAEELFARKCGSCHTIGKGVRVGPDLKDAHKRQSRSWLLGFVKQPSAYLDSDASARNLLAQFNGVRMPDLGLSDAEAAMLVDLLVRCSTEPCDLAGKFTAARLATKEDVARGRDFFLGNLALKNGGAPCVSCHTVRGIGSSVPGGLLGKDLTNAFARIGDEGLDAALANPAYPLMNRIFTQHPLDPAEVFALRSFLYTANLGVDPGGDGALNVGLFGALGTIVAFVVLNAAWARRLKGVRKPLLARKGASS